MLLLAAELKTVSQMDWHHLQLLTWNIIKIIWILFKKKGSGLASLIIQKCNNSQHYSQTHRRLGYIEEEACVYVMASLFPQFKSFFNRKIPLLDECPEWGIAVIHYMWPTGLTAVQSPLLLKIITCKICQFEQQLLFCCCSEVIRA